MNTRGQKKGKNGGKKTNLKERKQGPDTTSNAKDKVESLSHDKCQPTGFVTSMCKPTDSTASVASTSVPLRKDRKIWIQIAVVGVQLYVFSLAICLFYTILQ